MTGLSILMVTPRFEPSLGGVETHVRAVGDRLVARGHVVTVLTADAAPGLPSDACLDGLRVVRVAGLPKGRDLRLPPALPRAMAGIRADVIHVQGWHTLVPPVALAAAQHARRPTILTFHSGGHSSTVRTRLRGVQLLALRPWIRGARRLVAVSDFEAGWLARSLRVARRRFVVIPNGTDLPAVASDVARDPGLVVSLGRLEAYKGHDRLIEALPWLLRARPHAHLRIAGAGPDEARLRALAERVGVGPRVEIGPVDGGRQGVANLLARAGAVALLSRYESQGMAAWEAARAGAPLVVEAASALEELVAAGLATGVRPDGGPAEVSAALIRATISTSPARLPISLPTWDEAAGRLEALYHPVRDGRPA